MPLEQLGSVGAAQVTRLPTNPFGEVTIGNYDAAFVGLTGAVIQAALDAGHKSIRIVNGTFTITSAITSATNRLTISLSSAVTIVIAHSGATGFLSLTGDGVRVFGNGARVQIDTFVASQKIVRMSGKDVRIDDLSFDCLDSTATGFTGGTGASYGHEAAFLLGTNANSGLASHNPMRLISLENATAKRITNCTFYPNKGVTCAYSEGSGVGASPGNLIITGCHFRSEDDNYTAIGTHRLCYRAIDINGDEYGVINSNTFFQIGTNASPMDAAIFLRAHINTLIESGHWTVSGNNIERCPSPNTIKIWGASSITINGNMIGLNGEFASAESGADALGKATILLTGYDGIDATTSGVLGIIISNNDLHNLAKSLTDGAFIYLGATKGVIILGNRFGVCASNNAIYVAAGTNAKFAIQNNSFISEGGAPCAIKLAGVFSITDGCSIGGNHYDNFTAFIVDQSNAGAAGRRKILSGVQDQVTGNDPWSYLSGATITVTGTNTFQDTADSFALLAVGDLVMAVGHPTAANNGLHRITAKPANGITVASTLTNDGVGRAVRFIKANQVLATNYNTNL